MEGALGPRGDCCTGESQGGCYLEKVKGWGGGQSPPLTGAELYGPGQATCPPSCQEPCWDPLTETPAHDLGSAGNKYPV